MCLLTRHWDELALKLTDMKITEPCPEGEDYFAAPDSNIGGCQPDNWLWWEINDEKGGIILRKLIRQLFQHYIVQKMSPQSGQQRRVYGLSYESSSINQWRHRSNVSIWKKENTASRRKAAIGTARKTFHASGMIDLHHERIPDEVSTKVVLTTVHWNCIFFLVEDNAWDEELILTIWRFTKSWITEWNMV